MISIRTPCFWTPDGPERDAGLPGRVGPGLDDAEDLLGARVRRQVEVVAEPAEQRVAHRAADQVDGMTRLGEALAELDQERGAAHQLPEGVALELLGIAGLGHGQEAYGAVP